jgi:cold shock protein
LPFKSPENPPIKANSEWHHFVLIRPNLDFAANHAHMRLANRRLRRKLMPEKRLLLLSRATSSGRAFAAGFPVFAKGKHHMITGTVKFFNADKGYGFISPENGGDDNFVHISAVERAGMSTLNKDQRVRYELETDRRGKTSAVNLEAA